MSDAQTQAQPPMPAAMPMPLAGALSLSPDQFDQLARLDAASAWLANLTSPNTCRAYRSDILHFFEFLGQGTSIEVLARVQRPHVAAWRDALLAQGLAPDTVRRKLAAVSSLYRDLCEGGALGHNPAAGVRRPTSGYVWSACNLLHRHGIRSHKVSKIKYLS